MYQSPSAATTPLYSQVTGKFCFPLPYGPGGTIAKASGTDSPLLIGSDATVTASAPNFNVAATNKLPHINPRDKVAFQNTGEADGLYTVLTVTSDDSMTVSGPGQALSAGKIWFPKPMNWQKIEGTGTMFTQHVTVGDYLVSLGTVVQIAKVMKIESNTVLYLEGGFYGTVSGAPLLISKTGQMSEINITCGGAGTVNEVAVAEDQVLNFKSPNGLNPVYGDAGSSTFDITIVANPANG